MSDTSENLETMTLAQLTAPFEKGDVKFKPQALSNDGTKALAVPYIDARAVMDRLDDVLGPENWSDEYLVISPDSVMCTLAIRFPGAKDGEWTRKADVGSKSGQPDEGDQMKAAFSDGLKRAAIKFGIGRYIYSLPKQWCDCETYEKGGKKHFKKWKSEPQVPGQPRQQPKQEQPKGPPTEKDFELAKQAFGKANSTEYLDKLWNAAKERGFSKEQLTVLANTAKARGQELEAKQAA